MVLFAFRPLCFDRRVRLCYCTVERFRDWEIFWIVKTKSCLQIYQKIKAHFHVTRAHNIQYIVTVNVNAMFQGQTSIYFPESWIQTDVFSLLFSKKYSGSGRLSANSKVIHQRWLWLKGRNAYRRRTVWQRTFLLCKVTFWNCKPPLNLPSIDELDLWGLPGGKSGGMSVKRSTNICVERFVNINVTDLIIPFKTTNI